jgi:hypothetical protein
LYLQFVIVQKTMLTAMEAEGELPLTSAPTQLVSDWSCIWTCSSVTVPPVTRIILFNALMNSITTSSSLNIPSSVTQLKE